MGEELQMPVEPPSRLKACEYSAQGNALGLKRVAGLQPARWLGSLPRASLALLARPGL